MNWYIKVLTNYAEFSGRAQRAEYWFFVLINTVVTIALGVVDGALGLFDPASGLGLFSGVYSLVVLIPSFAVAVRRLHDTDRSGWWLLLLLIPLIGVIVLIIFFVLDSTPGENQHGPNPKAA